MNQVLIVEDNEVFRSTLTDLFGLWRPDVKVLHAGNGAEGIEVASKYQPDLILMDGNMPVMDGITAAKELKERPETKDIPVIGMTARQGEFMRISAGLKSTCSFFLAKPFEMSDLIKTISSLHLY